MIRVVRFGIALTALVAVVLQYTTFIEGDEIGLFGETIRYFSFFTITTNCIVAFAWGVQALLPDSGLGHFFRRDSVRTAIAGYIVLVGVIYHLLLAAQFDPQGLQLFADILLHTIVPIAVFAEWLFFSESRSARYSQAIGWQIYPVVYTAYTLIKGSFTGFYPYPFLDVNALGYGGVAAQLAGLIVAFTLTSFIFVGIGRLQKRMMG